MSPSVLICDTLLEIFLCDDGQWTRDPHSARDFHTTFAATTHCVRERLSHVQVIVNVPGQRDTGVNAFVTHAWRN